MRGVRSHCYHAAVNRGESRSGGFEAEPDGRAWETSHVAVLVLLVAVGACTNDGAEALETATSTPVALSPKQLLAQASRELVPTPVAGVELGMSAAELARVRPAAYRHEAGDHPEWLAYTEAGDRAHAYYLFSRTSLTLSRLQVLTTLDDHAAISGRLRALQQRFGAAEMAFDCPPVSGQQLPVRRFVWMRGPVAGVDSYLLTDKTVSVTWSVELRTALLASVGAAHCDLVKSDRLSWFPSADRP